MDGDVVGPDAAAVSPPDRPALMMVMGVVAAEGLGAAAADFGDAWIDDRAHGCLLRLDARRGTVTARIRVDGRLAIGAGARAVWALQSGGGYGLGLRGPLLKVDPGTNRTDVAWPSLTRTPLTSSKLPTSWRLEVSNPASSTSAIRGGSIAS